MTEKNIKFIISTNAVAASKNIKNLRVLMIFIVFVVIKCSDFWASKIIEKPSKILSKSTKNRFQNKFKKHIQKTHEKILQNASK